VWVAGEIMEIAAVKIDFGGSMVELLVY